MHRDKAHSNLPSRTIVIKLGTSSIVHETTYQPLLATLSALVETVIELKRNGHKVVLVSSGAIGVGLKRMNLAKKPDNLAGKQALAAIGQGRLIALWDNLFGLFDQPIAQILLTRGDISDRTRYLNAVNTFKELLLLGVVPIVNENDTVSVSEIKFGDNDTLSAITSSMIRADYLFLLTDVDGLYTSNPRKDPDAKQIEVVSSIAAIRAVVSTTTLGSSLGTGGMETKLIAAEIATAAGVKAIITSSKDPRKVIKIIEYDMLAQNGVVVTDPAPASTSSDASLPIPTERPPHTLFLASAEPMRDLKSWTRHTLHPSGSVVVDAGAYHVLSKRESGGRLLAVGVIGVIGAFAAQQAVRIVVRRRSVGEEERKEETKRYKKAVDVTNENSPHLCILAEDEYVPFVDPTKLTMSILLCESSTRTDSGDGDGRADSEQLSRDPREPAVPHPMKQAVSQEGAISDGANSLEKKRKSDVNLQEDDVIEVGRGLANYNSAQILAVKGLHSSFLPQLLGYADSEYVVENITIQSPSDPTQPLVQLS